MAKTERQTHDFMNVESFSQLPFIRPAPPVKDNECAIRLFGKEFGSRINSTGDKSESDENNNIAQQGESNNQESGDNTDQTSSRRFECHYCCRTFPTSQALGGHQNAHKRERQHAKRAHLQSAIAQGSFSEAHVYGLMNYRSASTLSMPYHSWNNSNTRIYGNADRQPTINGSPLALWRIPAGHGSSAMTREQLSSMHQKLPLFSTKDDRHLKPLSSMSSSPSPLGRFGYDKLKPSMQEHVSLDLHL